MHRVERLSIREISRRTGLHRKTIRRALAAETPPRYSRAPAASKLDPFRDWICEQLRARPDDPVVAAARDGQPSWAMRAARRSSMTTCARSVRGSWCARTFQRTIYRPGELVQCDLWEPREPVPVGHGQTRRGWVVTAELCWSRVIAGALIFSKQAPDILWGLGRCLERIGALPEKLVWDREGAIHAGGGRPTDAFAGVLRAARGRLGDPRRRRRAGQGRAGALAPVHAHQLRARPAVREPAGLPAAARRLVRSRQPAGASHRPRRPGRAARSRSARGCGRCPAAMPDCDRRFVVRVPQQPYLRVDRNDYSIDPAFAGRRVEVRVSQSEVTAVVLDTGELACRHRRSVRRRADDHRPGAPERARAPARPAPPAPRRRRRDPAAGPL